VAYESYAWMHHVYGIRGIRNANGHQFDTVIHNFFDPDECHPAAAEPADYLLYVGRFIPLKGVQVAADLARRAGRPLIVAGPGVTRSSEGLIEAPELKIEGDVQYVGTVGFAERAELMAGAYAVLTPTLYVEPFGGVAVEAMLCGAPVVASDWGSFTEIVTPDVGRRFRTLRQGDRAVNEVGELDRAAIREAAISRWSLDAIGPRFTAWFDSLYTLWDEDGYNA
jgi:glycosyltransferase involved in cell wall biosynthesis